MLGKTEDRRRMGHDRTEDDKVGWHHRLNGYEFKQTPGDSERQGNLVRCNPWGRKLSQLRD